MLYINTNRHFLVTLDGEIHGSLDASSSSHGALIFVDGVSSTSPEPKSETVRKASPDSVASYFKSVPRPSGDNFKGMEIYSFFY